MSRTTLPAPDGTSSSARVIADADEVTVRFNADRPDGWTATASTMIRIPVIDVAVLAIAPPTGEGVVEQILGDLGYATLGLRDLTRAMSLHISPLTHAYARSAQGYALGTLGLLDDADAAFDDSLMRAPGNAWTFFRRGMIRLAYGRFGVALEDFERAVAERDPELTDAQRGKALWILSRASDYRKGAT